VIREIEIWRVAVLMVNRYADEPEANSFKRAEELRPKCASRRSSPKLEGRAIYAFPALALLFNEAGWALLRSDDLQSSSSPHP
jgi:hypothetical protein